MMRLAHKTPYPPMPQEVIVVEGRDDTRRLKMIWPEIRTLETRGSAIDEACLDRIARMARQWGVIIFTDPDSPGKRIRRIITQHVPTAKQAYLAKHQAVSVKKKRQQSIGVEHASDEAILQALQEAMTPAACPQVPALSLADLLALDLAGHPKAKQYRQYLGHKLHFGPQNAKQLIRHLQMFEIGYDEVAAMMQEIKREEAARSDDATTYRQSTENP